MRRFRHPVCLDDRALNTASSSPMTVGGSDDDEERTKRNGVGER